MYENEIYSNSETGQYTAYQTNGTVYNTGADEKAGIGKKNGKKSKGVFRKIVLSMTLGLVFGVFAGSGFYAVRYGANRLLQPKNQEAISSDPSGSPTAIPNQELTNVNQITYVNTDISDVVEKVMPAMVSIVNNYTEKGMTFWGQSYSQPGASSGSGIIVAENESELLIVSNNHVVEETDELKVSFIDGSEAVARIKGLDADMDLAVIAVSLEDISQETKDAITIATLGDSDSLKLGSPVIAIGNALGYGQSVTNGIISALNREVTMDDGSIGTFIQTNAAINPGNSGGALLNINGEVIGINSNKIGSTYVEGMGYAIPISSASPIIADLLERETRTDKVAEEERGYMGIQLKDMAEQYAQMYDVPQGVFVYSVEDGSAAQKAGLQKGDIIVKFDGQRTSSGAALQNILQYYKAGETATITVKRFANGEYETYDFEITLGSR